MDYGPNLHNIYMSSTYSSWNKNPVIQTEKISKMYRCSLQTYFFFTLQVKAESFDFTCSLWNTKVEQKDHCSPTPSTLSGTLAIKCPSNPTSISFAWKLLFK